MYVFECTMPTCKYMSDYKESAPKECPECGGKRYILHFGKAARKFLSGIRYSYALGCNPHEIERFQKKWPWMKFTPDGRCITENYTERKRVLKARGYVDLQ